MNRVIHITFLLCLSSATSASAMCFAEASRQYGIPEALLRATAQVESGNKPGAIGRNSDGTSDLGLMQINSSWLPKLSTWGISRGVLLNDPCMNLKVGAWIMAENFRRHGYTWNGVGAYNVGCAKLGRIECDKRRNRYSAKIYKALAKNERAGATVLAQAQPPSHLDGISTVQFGTADAASAKDDS